MASFRPNDDGFRELFTSPEMQALCLEAAQKIEAQANAKAAAAAHSHCQPYRAIADVHANTAVGHVFCAMQFNGLEAAYGCLKTSI